MIFKYLILAYPVHKKCIQNMQQLTTQCSYSQRTRLFILCQYLISLKYIFPLHSNKCYSRLGHVSMRGQPISIGGGCNFVGTVIHEMMHCIGFFHEQSRRDRDDHVEIIEDNIDTDRKSYLLWEGGFLGTMIHHTRLNCGEVMSPGVSQL